MDITINDEINAKATAIRQLLSKEGIDQLSKDHTTILAKKIDGTLREAGFESHYFQDLNNNESKKLPKNMVQKSLADLLRNDGMPSDIVTQVEKIWAQHMDTLLKEIHAQIAASKKSTPQNKIEIETPHHIKTFSGFANVLKYAAIGIAPPGVDIALYYSAAEQVLNKAQEDLNKKKLSPEQFHIINNATENTFVLAVCASLIPDPSGISSDVAVRYGNNRAIEELLAAGVPKTQAENYQIGSFIQVMENTADAVSKSQSNQNDIEQLKNPYNEVPLSIALGFSASELAVFGEMSEKFNGNALKLEVIRHPDFEKLKHLSNQDLSLLSQSVNAGIDPNVRVNEADEIFISPQLTIDSSNSPAAQTTTEKNILAGNNQASFVEVAKGLSAITADGISKTASQFASSVKAVISDPEIINEIITQEIRTQYCKDLKGKLDNGGKPITQHQIDQCIAFATGDMEELKRLTELTISNAR